MKYHPHQIYHIYNQGNNREKIFLQERNYLFFLGKMRRFLLPLVDILAYCLMPNHFHWLVYTRPEACFLSKAVKPRKKYLPAGAWASLPREDDKQQELSHAIGTLLRTYTRAINIQENRSGALFRPKTKAKDGWIDGFITLEGKHKDLFFRPGNDYARQCFHYIHENPKEAKLVSKAEAWLYSSARDYAGLRKKSLCNLLLAKELLDIPLTWHR
ncbi:MAG: hypothetical protein J5I98_31570 [Phaeodactylibacter sp.]|nr:hypothetical protein [Phaeodactylibacter sp.]